MMIEFEFFKNWNWELFKNIIEAISSIFVAGCALVALYSWKKEFLGKKKLEFSELLIEKIYDFKDMIGYIRGCYSSNQETDEVKETLFKNGQKCEGNAYYLIPLLRLNQTFKRRSDFLNLKYKAMIYFGKDIEKIFVEFYKIINEIKFASQQLYQLSNDWDNFDKDLRIKYESIIWGIDGDKIEKKLDENIKKIEELTKDFVKVC